MADIVRNDENSKKTKSTTRKEVTLDEAKTTKNDIQVHFGNVKLIEIKLLEGIGKTVVEMLKILQEMQKKIKE